MPLAEFQDQFPEVCQHLLQTKRKNRVGHSYLFIGDDSTLLEQFVAAWAQVCACQSPSANGDACGDCHTCKQLAAGHYPERYEIRPTSKSRRIVVDEVRNFEHQLGLATGKNQIKMGIIVDADCMGEEAQNAFLKTLEEPTAHTLLFLMTTQPRKLLPTIRSRCQLISLLRNRRSYDLALEFDVFRQLARLRCNAGAAVGLSVANQLCTVFDQLRERAELSVGEEHDQRWETVAADDKSLQKRIEEQRKARIEAEYLRLREEIGDAIQTWFLQQCLIAAGADPALLPHPEFLQAAAAENHYRPSREDAEQNAVNAAELLRFLSARVQERLALEAFCLDVVAKKTQKS